MRKFDNIPKDMLSRLVSTIKSKLALVAFTGKLSSAENDTGFITKESLPKAVKLTGVIKGTGTFDENGNVDILTSRKGCIAYAGNTNGGWYNVAYAAVPKVYQDYSASFLVQCTYANDKSFGILRVMSRILPTGLSSASITLECTNMADPTGIVLTYNDNDSGRIELRIWVRNQVQWQGVTFTVLSESLGGDIDGVFTLYNPTGSDTLSEIPAEYTQVPCTLATIQNPVANMTRVKGGNESEYRDGDVNLTYSNVGAFPGAKEIGDGVSLNSCFATAVYLGLKDRTYPNSPFAARDFVLLAFRSGSAVKQIFIVSDSNVDYIYTRYRVSGTWSEWRPLPTGIKGNAETDYRGGLVNLTPENIGAINKNGDSVPGVVQFKNMQIVALETGNNGTGGYVIFARIKITSGYCNHTIMMNVGGRGIPMSTMLFIGFASEPNHDPALGVFLKYGGMTFPFYIKKSAESTWDLCVQKNENYGYVMVLDVRGRSTGMYEISYPNIQINTADFVASEWTEAQLGGKIKEAENLTGFISASTVDKTAEPTNQIGYWNGGDLTKAIYGQNDGATYRQAYSNSWIHDIYGDYRTGQIALRGKNNGGWQAWRKVVDHLNYDTLIPVATTGKAGLMSAADKTKLNSITTSSSRKYKKNIEEMDEGEARKLLELVPVRYDYINEEDGTDCYGLIAEDVAEVMRYPVVYVDGEPDAINYEKFVPYLIKMVQVQDMEIGELKRKIENL